MNWRLASRLSVVTLALLVVLVVAVLSLHNAAGAPATGLNSTPTTAPTGAQGTDLGGVPAPAFSLHDQFGKLVTLSQFAGKPLVLTFMYTHCPDVCPIMAERLHSVIVGLGNDAQRVAVVAISVDPRGDSVASALAFSQVHRMVNYWHFLVGTQNELAPVWTKYAIDAQPAASTVSMHTAILYVIDKHGHERWLLDQDFSTAQMTGDLQALLKE